MRNGSMVFHPPMLPCDTSPLHPLKLDKELALLCLFI